MDVFLDVASYSLQNIFRYFGRAYCFPHQGDKDSYSSVSEPKILHVLWVCYTCRVCTYDRVPSNLLQACLCAASESFQLQLATCFHNVNADWRNECQWATHDSRLTLMSSQANDSCWRANVTVASVTRLMETSSDIKIMYQSGFMRSCFIRRVCVRRQTLKSVKKPK